MSYNVEIAVSIVIGFSIIGVLVIIFISYNNYKKNKKIEWYDEFLSDEYTEFKDTEELRFIYNAILYTIKNSHNSELVNKLSNKYHRLIDTKTIQDIDDFIDRNLDKFDYNDNALQYYYGFILRLESVIKNNPNNIQYKNKLEIAIKKYKYISYIVKDINNIRETMSNDILDILDINKYKEQGIIRDTEFDEYLEKYMKIINDSNILNIYRYIIYNIPISDKITLNNINKYLIQIKNSVYSNNEIDLSNVDSHIDRHDLQKYASNYNNDKKDEEFYKIQTKLLNDGIITGDIIIHPPRQ